MIKTSLKELLSVIIIPVCIALIALVINPALLTGKAIIIIIGVIAVCFILLIFLETGININSRVMEILESMPVYQTPMRGREKELSDITDGLSRQSQKHILLIEGESGIGKTTIISNFVSMNKKKYDLVIWQALYDAPTSTQIVNGWLNRFTASIPDMSFDGRLSSFLKQIRDNKYKRAIIIFDNAESILHNANNSFELPYEYIKLIKALIEFSFCDISIVITSSIDIANLHKGEITPITIKKLKNDSIKQIVYDKTKINFKEEDLKVACGNPSAAILMASSYNAGNSSYEGDFESIVSRKMEIMTSKQKRIIALCSIAKRPLSVVEIQELWKTMPPYSLINEKEIVSLKDSFFLEKVSTDKYIVNAIVAAVISDKTINDMVSIFSLEEIDKESYLRSIPLDYAKWSGKIRNEVRKQLFSKINDRLLCQVGKEINKFTANEVHSIFEKIIDIIEDENDYLPSNIVSLMIYYGVDFNNIVFPSIKLIGVDFSRTHMFNTNLLQTKLINCEFSDRIGSAYAVCFAGEDRILVGLQSGAIELRDMLTLSRITRAERHSEPVRALYYDDNNKKIVSGGEDGKVVIYNLDLSHRKTIQLHSRWVWRFVQLDSNTIITIGCDGQIGIVDLCRDLVKFRISVPSQRIWDAAILNGYLYVGSEDGILWRGDLNNINNRDASWDIAFHAQYPIKACCVCGSNIVIGCRNGMVYSINSDNGYHSTLISQQKGCIRSIKNIPNKTNFIAVGDMGVAVEYDVLNKQQISEFTVQSSRTWSIDILKDGKAVSVGDDRTIHVWDTKDILSLRIVQGNGQSLRNADIANGKMILACADDFLRLKDKDRIIPWKVFRPKKRILGVVSLKNGNWAYTFEDGKIMMDISCGNPKEIQAHKGAIECIARNSNGTLFATGGEDRTINVFDYNGTKKKSPVELHSSRIWSLSFSPDGKKLASAGGDFIIGIWSVKAADIISSCVGHLNLVLSVCWVGSNKICSAGTDGSIRLWNANTGSLIKMKNIACVIRDLIVVDGCVYGVGRFVSESNWAIISWNLKTDQLREDRLNVKGGAARTIIYDENDLYVGGDRPILLCVDKVTLNTKKSFRIPGVYEGMKIAKHQCSSVDFDCLELLGASIER